MTVENVIKLSLVYIPVVFVLMGVILSFVSGDKTTTSMLIGGGLGSFGTLMRTELGDKTEINRNKIEVNE